MTSSGGQTSGTPASLVLICLTLFLLLLPLTLTKPGLPTTLKADEAAYYLASLSLWHDGDLVCDEKDTRRAFREFADAENLALMSSGPGEPVYFGVPILYPLLATPFVAIFGANGLSFVNAALLVAMIWMGFAYLRRFNTELSAALFSAAFFLLSTAFVYVFWLQAEVYNMACVMAAFFLIEPASEPSDRLLGRPSVLRPGLRAATSAALLAAASYSKPMLAVLALPMIYGLLKERRWRALSAFATSSVLTTILVAGSSLALTDQLWPYFAPRYGIGLHSPVDYMERRVEPRLRSQESTAPPIEQLSRSAREARVTLVPLLRQSTREFFFGRHGGFVVYMPFAVLAILFFLLNDRRSGFRWVLLISSAVAAVLFVTLIRGNWLGGGGFVGNRYFATVYPAFLFLVRRLRPSWLIAVGFAAAALFLGPLLITPLGAPVLYPSLQAHVRNQPFPHLEPEWSIVRALDGYRNVAQSGANFHGRRDEILDRGDEIWVHGAKPVEINMLTVNRAEKFVFDIRSLAPDNRIEICLQRDCRKLVFEPGSEAPARQRVVFEPGSPKALPPSGRPGPAFRYQLRIESEWGEQPRWRSARKDHMYVGTAFAFLGTGGEVARNLRSVDWLQVTAPTSLEGGQDFVALVELENSSPHPWPSTGPGRVRIGHYWLDESGERLADGAIRSDLPRDVASGERIESKVSVTAPADPGTYTLVLDLLRERIHWFSSRKRDTSYRLELEVVGPPAAGPSHPRAPAE